MVRRDVKKILMYFLRKEVHEKTADWGELRRVNSQVILKRGLPNIPNLMIRSNEGLSFLGIVNWRKELRLYLFDSDGRMLHGQSYYNNLEEVYKDLKSRSKKITRYPPLKKPITQAQHESQLDKQFKKVWLHLAKIFHISQKITKNRPLIKESATASDDIFGTRVTEEFIYIPTKSQNLETIFAFYSLFFFLPNNIHQNKIIGEAVAFNLLRSIKKYQTERVHSNWEFSTIFNQVSVWHKKDPIKLLKALNRISEYYNSTWKTKDFLELVESEFDIIEYTTRRKISDLFYDIFSKTLNLDFLVLSTFLGLPFGIEYSIPVENSENELISVFKALRHWQISKVLDYLNQQQNLISSGILKAIKEALNFQYGCVIEINIDTNDNTIVLLKNKSDLPIILTTAVQISPNGREFPIIFQEVVLEPLLVTSFDIRTINIKEELPVRVEYVILRTPKSIIKPIFKGAIIF